MCGKWLKLKQRERGSVLKYDFAGSTATPAQHAATWSALITVSNCTPV
jgi:hypothetical protein